MKEILISFFVMLFAIPLAYIAAIIILSLVFNSIEVILRKRIINFSIPTIYKIIFTYLWVLSAASSFFFISKLNPESWWIKLVGFITVYYLFYQLSKEANKIKYSLENNTADQMLKSPMKYNSNKYAFFGFQSSVYSVPGYILFWIWPELIDYMTLPILKEWVLKFTELI